LQISWPTEHIKDFKAIDFLQVPFESLKRTSRDRKYIIDDLQALVTAIKDTAEKQCSEQDRAGAVSQLITQLVSIQDQVWMANSSLM
jgi:hypothetical protein